MLKGGLTLIAALSLLRDAARLSVCPPFSLKPPRILSPAFQGGKPPRIVVEASSVLVDESVLQDVLRSKPRPNAKALIPPLCCAAQLSLASTVVLGFSMAEVGVSIQHDANHGAYLPTTWFSRLMGATLDMVRAPNPNSASESQHQNLTTTCDLA